MPKRPLKAALVILVTLALTVGLLGCNVNASSDTVVVGGKDFTEQDIMADMITLLIEQDTDLKVKKKTWLNSNVIWNSMKNGNIDIYVEYTGTGLVNILKQKAVSDPQQAYDLVKNEFKGKYDVTWLQPIGFNNTYAMAMRRSEAKKLNIASISDLAKQSPNLILGSEQDFMIREDTLPAMNKLYGTKFKSVKSMEIGLKYKAMANGNVDVIDAFSTDGKIPANDLVLLEDDKHLFPPYYAVPIIRNEVLKKHPELEKVINQLANKITDEEMQKLNKQVDIEHKKSLDVAKKWMQDQGLLTR
ncbi:glycine betaine ABC transporter substrate-binding protein [Laceyella putida]|uniref:Glycine betaine ABC transporter substrate-binding protein n=1 Tax=Laceyella putida TaxID=110101 RepID=A0ABW2RG12_9BACL